jgi:hypothetical protein
MARKVGQIVRRGNRTWLVRVYNGRDPGSKERKYLNQTVRGGLTVISAGEHNAARAIFVVHEFHSTSCQPAALARNHAEWSAFVNLLMAPDRQPGPACDLTYGVFGPAVVPGGGYVRFYIPFIVSQTPCCCGALR